MTDREMYWNGRQPDIWLRQTMARELSALCDAMGWDYDLVDEAGTWGGWPEVGRRQGVVIYPYGPSSREDGEEASFAFVVGETIHPSARDTIRSRNRGEKPDSVEGLISFNSGGYWWLADRGLMALCAFIKRLWVPSLTWLGCGGVKLSPVIESYLLGSEEEVLEAFRSAAFREFLEQCQIEPAGQKLRFRDGLRQDAEAWFQQRHPKFPELEAALDRKFSGFPWREARLTVLPFMENSDRIDLLRSGFDTLGDLVREGRKTFPLSDHHLRMEFDDYQRLQRSFRHTSESLHYLGEPTTPITAEDLAPHIPPPAETNQRPEVAHPPCTVLDASDPELIALKQDLVASLQVDPPTTLLDLYTRLGRRAQQAQMRMAVWPHLLVVEFGEGRVGLIPFGDLLAPIERFRICFEVDADAFMPEVAEYLNTMGLQVSLRHDALENAPAEGVPESDRGSVIQEFLQALLRTMADRYEPTPRHGMDQPEEAREWLQRLSQGFCSMDRVELPWRYWKGYLVNCLYGYGKSFCLVDWTLLRELATFCSSHLYAPVPELFALGRDFHSEGLQLAIGLPNRLTVSEVFQRSSEISTWYEKVRTVLPEENSWAHFELCESIRSIETFLEFAKKEFEPGLSLRGLKRYLLGEPSWTPWWPLAQALWVSHCGLCSECKHRWNTREGEAVCRLTTRLLSNPEETFCLAHSDIYREMPTPACLPPHFRVQPGGVVGFAESEPGEVTSPDTWQEMPAFPRLRSESVSLDDIEDI